MTLDILPVGGGRKAYWYKDVLTAVPSGATDTVTMKKLPAGWYYVRFFGTQAAATTDPTLATQIFSTAAQTVASGVPGALDTDTSVAVAVDLEVAQTTFSGIIAPTALTLVFPSPVYIPYGAQIIYTKNGGTAINLDMVFIEA